MKCLCGWNVKNKLEIKFFCLFAEGLDHSPRQRLGLCRGPLPEPSAKKFTKKFLRAFFAEGLLAALGKEGVFAEGLLVALGKEFFEKILLNFFAEGRW